MDVVNLVDRLIKKNVNKGFIMHAMDKIMHNIG